MNLQVKRFHFGPTATIGRLYVDGSFHSYTLEDTVRELPGVAVEKWKVAGKTAIPVGTYTVALTFSNRFQKVLPQLLNVPGFEGIRIHPGNKSADTEGCLLVGATWDEAIEDWIGGSRAVFDPLFELLQKAQGAIKLTVE